MKTFNKILAIFATLAIVALSAYNTHKVGEQAKTLAELQQYHSYDNVEQTDTMSITNPYVGELEPTDNLWESVEEVIQFQRDELEWESHRKRFLKIPEESLRHIVSQEKGLELNMEDIVEKYEKNKKFYDAFEKGYTTAFEVKHTTDNLPPNTSTKQQEKLDTIANK